MQIILNSLISGAIYVLIALSFTVIYRTVKFLHIAHGAVYTLGAYLSFTVFEILFINNQVNAFVFLLSAFVVIIIGALLLGLLIDRFVYRPLRNKTASELIFLLASFGIFIFVQNLLQLIYGAKIFSINNLLFSESNKIMGANITDNQIILIISSIVLSLCVSLYIKYSKKGKAMRAVSDDDIASNVVGIDSEKIIITSILIGSALVSLSGALIALETSIKPFMGFNAILKGIIASIVGGIGSILGAIFGGLFLGLTENLGIWKLPAAWKDAIAFAVLIIFLLVRPQGIMGKKNDKD